jgi:hypothetical protein
MPSARPAARSRHSPLAGGTRRVPYGHFYDVVHDAIPFQSKNPLHFTDGALTLLLL